MYDTAWVLAFGGQVCVVRTNKKITGWKIRKAIRGTGDIRFSGCSSLSKNDTGVRRLVEKAAHVEFI